MTRWRHLLLLLLALALWAPAARPAAQSFQDARPNIVLIQADDLGYGDLSVYGQRRFETPSIDRLAREGTRFTLYYSGSTVCAPSRAALLMGLHTGHVSISGNLELPSPESDRTVGMVLRDAGYRTAVIGKWGLGSPGTTGQPDRKGFAHSFGFPDHRHAHRQFTEQLYRNAQRVESVPDRDYANDLFTREAARRRRASEIARKTRFGTHGATTMADHVAGRCSPVMNMTCQ